MTEAGLSLLLIVVLLVAHFVGDFLCQSDWMAVNKSKRWDALAWHVLVYSVVLFVFSLMLDPNLTPEGSWPWLKAVCVFVFVNGAAHFAQDAITSRITSRLWFIRWHQYGTLVNLPNGSAGYAQTGEILPTRHWFFVAIGADQLLHYVTLFVTAGWWLQ